MLHKTDKKFAVIEQTKTGPVARGRFVWQGLVDRVPDDDLFARVVAGGGSDIAVDGPEFRC